MSKRGPRRCILYLLLEHIGTRDPVLIVMRHHTFMVLIRTLQDPTEPLCRP